MLHQVKHNYILTKAPFFSLLLSIWLLFFSMLSSIILKPVLAIQNVDLRQQTSEPSIHAVSAVLIDNQSGRILFEKDKDKEMVPASITKIMTLLLIFDALDRRQIQWEDQVTVSENAASMGGSQVYLETGETQSVKDLVKCISIASANDAAVAMAEFLAGSETEFVKQMNQRAEGLGMKHTHFLNCNGLDDTIDKGHYSSAYDVALMSRELIQKHPDISTFSTCWMDQITHHTHKGASSFTLTNTNKLLRTYQGITGLKTGSTAKARYCFSGTASRGGISLTAVVMAAADPRSRFHEAAELLDYGFAHSKAYHDDTSKIKLPKITVQNGQQSYIPAKITKDFDRILWMGESTEKLSRQIETRKNLQAPIRKDMVIGRVAYIYQGKVIEEIPILAAKDIKEAAWLDYYKRLLKKWLML